MYFNKKGLADQRTLTEKPDNDMLLAAGNACINQTTSC